ncbi:MAG: pyridoxal phosphate-dependent aminotransferase [Bacteroidales bacterium]|nr:pyridoxal phosphate-dependent aminotransferase [Bacteroidales bacterium]
MKRRTFLNRVALLGASGLVAPELLFGLTGCKEAVEAAGLSVGGWDFDEVIDRSGTYSIKYDRAEKMGGKLPMWIADMDFRTAPYVSDALVGRVKRDVMGYTSIPDKYYEAIVSWVEARQGWRMEREWVNYCPGVITGIAAAIECFSSPGDKVIVQPPVYNSFMQYAEGLGRIVANNPLIFENGSYRMDLEHLESVIDDRTRMLILCNPHNPGGMMWDRDSLVRIAQICERHGVIVLSDEIHGDLALGGRRHIPFCSVSGEAAKVGLIFTGPTKAFNVAGLHTAQTYIPNKELRERFQDYLDRRKLTEASIPAIELTIAAYSHEPRWLDEMKLYLQGNIDYVADFLAREIPAIKVVKPEASFLMWLDCRALGLDQNGLVSLFQDKAGILINNGESYRQGGTGFIRLNIGCPRSICRQAMSRLQAALR